MNIDVIMSLFNPDEPFLNNKAAMFGFTSSVEAAKYSGGLFAKGISKRKTKNIRFLYVYDDSETLITTTFIMNALTPEEVAKKYFDRRRRLFEAGIIRMFGDKNGVSFAETFADQVPGVGKDISDVDEYFSQRVLLPEPEIFKPDLTYIMPLLVLYLLFCFLSLLFLLIERWAAKE